MTEAGAASRSVAALARPSGQTERRRLSALDGCDPSGSASFDSGSAWRDVTVVLVLPVGPPPGVDHVLVVLDRPHVVERRNDSGDGPEEGHHQLDDDPPEAEEVPEPEDPPERAVAAERGVAPVEEPVDRRGVLERRLDRAALAGRPAHSGDEVGADVLEQRRFDRVVRVVGAVGLTRRRDSDDAPHRGEGEPQHREERSACAARPQQVPGKHADGHRVERQPDQGPGEASRLRLFQVDRLLLELACVRTGRPVRSLVLVVVDLTTAHPGPRPEHQLEGHEDHEQARDHDPDEPGLGPLQRLLREDHVQQRSDPGEGRVAPQAEMDQPMHGRQITDLPQRCVKQRLLLPKVRNERRVPSQVSFIPFYESIVNNIV